MELDWQSQQLEAWSPSQTPQSLHQEFHPLLWAPQPVTALLQYGTPSRWEVSTAERIDPTLPQATYQLGCQNLTKVVSDTVYQQGLQVK